MADIDIDCLIAIVTGIQLKAELGDRPLAYRIEQAIRERLTEMLPKPPTGEPFPLVPIVVSDVYYLNNEELQTRPTISIGGLGNNAVSAMLVEPLPTAMSIENSLVIQMDLEFNDMRVAVWGMNHLDTIRAVDTFVVKGYLNAFIDQVIEKHKSNAP